MRVDLEAALELTRDDDLWRATVPAGWGQGRATFGGLVAAYLARAVEAAHERPIHGVDVYFLRPVPPGPVQLRETGTREGKYFSHVEMTLLVDGEQAAVGRFLLADDAPGPFDAVPPTPKPSKPLAEAFAMPFIEGITPEFTQHLDIHYTEGDIPFSGSQQAVSGGFVRSQHPVTGVAGLLMHIDAWPPPVLALSDKPAAASTVRWHVQFHDRVADADGQQWSWFRGEANWRTGRLATVTGVLVRDRRCIAFCEQTVAMYA